MKITSYKDKSGKTLYRFYIYIGTDPMTGKPIRTNRQGFKSKKEAELAYLALKSQQESMDKPKQYTFQEVYEMWLEDYKKTVRESTLKRTEGIFENHILSEIGKIFIDKINIKKAQECVNGWSKVLKKHKRIKTYAQKVFKHAKKLEIATKDPFEFVTMPKSTAPEKNIIPSSENFYDKDELLIFLSHAKSDLSPMWYTFFNLIAYSGIRRGEALALTWQDVDLKTSTLKINKTLSLDVDGKPILNQAKTDAGERKIILDSDTTAQLKKWKKEQLSALKTIDINQLVFSNSKNKFIVLSTPIKYLDKVIKKHELKRITLHGLRHTHCSLLFAAGASLKEVQDRMGHDDIKTTMDIYNHITKNQQQNAVDKLINFINATN